MAAGKIRAVIDRIYALTEAVEAHPYVDSGKRKGHVVLTMGRSRPCSTNSSNGTGCLCSL